MESIPSNSAFHSCLIRVRFYLTQISDVAGTEEIQLLFTLVHFNRCVVQVQGKIKGKSRGATSFGPLFYFPQTFEAFITLAIPKKHPCKSIKLLLK